MKTIDRAKVFMLSMLSFLSAYVLSAYVLYERFYNGEVVTKVEIGMLFMVLVSILVFVLIVKTNKKVNDKQLAHEIARNLGQPSVATPPELLLLWKATKGLLFFGILAWFTFIIGFYGNNIYEAIIVIAGCFTLGQVFKFLAVTIEQTLLKQNQ